MTDPAGTQRPLALDAVLVMLRPSKGEVWDEADMVVAAALLVELTHLGRLAVTGSGQALEVAVEDATPVGDELLDEALRTVGERPGRVTKLVRRLPTSDRVLQRLVAEGAVTVDSERKWGLKTVERHRPTPGAGREALVAMTKESVFGAMPPDARSAMLVSVLAIGRPLRAGVPEGQRPEVRRHLLAVRDSLGEEEAAVVATVDEVVRRANNGANSSVFR